MPGCLHRKQTQISRLLLFAKAGVIVAGSMALILVSLLTREGRGPSRKVIKRQPLWTPGGQKEFYIEGTVPLSDSAALKCCLLCTWPVALFAQTYRSCDSRATGRGRWHGTTACGWNQS